jgi:hypothetical protein
MKVSGLLSWTIPGQTDTKRKRLQINNGQPLEIIGAEGQNRTADTGIFSSNRYELKVTTDKCR